MPQQDNTAQNKQTSIQGVKPIQTGLPPIDPALIKTDNVSINSLPKGPAINILKPAEVKAPVPEVKVTVPEVKPEVSPVPVVSVVPKNPVVTPNPILSKPVNPVLDPLPQSKNLGSSDLGNPLSGVILPKNEVPEPLANGAKRRSLLDILFSQGKITKDFFESAKFEILSKNINEEDYINSKAIISPVDLLKAKSEAYGVPFVDLNREELKKEVLYKIPYETAKNNSVIAFDETPKGVKIALVDPLDIQKVKFIQTFLSQNVIPYFAEEDAIKKIIDTKYNAQFDTEVSQAVESVKGSGLVLEEELSSLNELNMNIQNAPVSRIVNMILEYGIKFKASDIHIEPKEGRVSVRYRIHGILSEKVTLPHQLAASVVSRIKILSELKIDEHRIPQDGRFEIQVGKTKVDLRISIMPVIHGEKIVIRILDKTSGILPLEKTGMHGSAFKTYSDSLHSTQGIILITGPTGSGKTVTLASSLSILNKQEVNIVTLEDPVEIRIDGVNQVQVNPDVGLTFATGLRSFLRQDPDVIMVGEIRDQETAQLAVQAALVGRLVLATLHTNSASAAIPRLLDMGVESFLLASVINVIIAQRLPRKLCLNCRQKVKASDEIVTKFHEVLDGLQGFDMFSFPKRDFPQVAPGVVPSTEAIKAAETTPKGKPEEIFIYKAVGCEKCNGTGYSGRIGIFEVLKMNEKIAKMLVEHRSSQSIQEQACQDGMITMLQDGFMKVLSGDTTFEEVIRVQN
ncbi:MAG: GspE/PulE family protein [bacterium]